MKVKSQLAVHDRLSTFVYNSAEIGVGVLVLAMGRLDELKFMGLHVRGSFEDCSDERKLLGPLRQSVNAPGVNPGIATAPLGGKKGVVEGGRDSALLWALCGG